MNPSLKLLDENGDVNAGVELAFSLFATMAKQEMEQKLARFARAKRRNAEVGKATSGNNTPFGYYKDANKYFQIDEYESGIVRLMYELILTKRYSIRLLCKELNERGYTHRGKNFGAYFVKRYLSSTIPVGYSIGIKGVQYNYPPIISKEIWEQAREIIGANKYGSFKGTKHYYLASKIMICPECKHHYSGTNGEYRCKLHTNHIELKEQGLPYCNSNISLLREVVDGILWSLTKEKHLNFLLKEKGATEERNRKQIEVNLQKIAAQQTILDKLEERRAKVNDDFYIRATITEKERDRYLARFAKERTKAQNAIANLESENQMLQNQLTTLSDLSYTAIQKLAADILTMDDEPKMFELVHQYIKEVTVDRIEALNKKGYLFTVYYMDGTTDKVVYLSRLYKTPTFRTTKKVDARAKAHFVADGTYFKYWDADRLKRDKDGMLILPDTSVAITDESAKATMMDELQEISVEPNMEHLLTNTA